MGHTLDRTSGMYMWDIGEVGQTCETAVEEHTVHVRQEKWDIHVRQEKWDIQYM